MTRLGPFFGSFVRPLFRANSDVPIARSSMSRWFLSLSPWPPPEFDYVPSPAPDKLDRLPFCLLCDDIDEAMSIVGSRREHCLGLVVTAGSSFDSERLGPFCRRLTVPEPWLPCLHDLASAELDTLEALRAEHDVSRARGREIERQQQERSTLEREYLEFRNNLLCDSVDHGNSEDTNDPANALYQSVFHGAISHAIIGTDLRGVITVFSEGAERLLGHSPDDVLGRMTPLSIHDPLEIEARAAELGMPAGFEVFVAAARRGEVETREWTYVRKDGSRVPVELSVSARRNRQGQIVGFVGIANDITERRSAEEEVRRLNRDLEGRVQERTLALRRTNSFIQATLESMDEGILAVDLHGDITWFNERFLEICRIPRRSMVQSLEQLLDEVILPHLRDPQGFLRRERALRANPEEESFAVLEFKDGRVLERCSRPQRIGERSIGSVWSYRDITERRKLESQLQQAQKLEAVGQLAAGIAHELNTPAQFVGDNLTFIKSSFDTMEELHEHYRQLLGRMEARGGWSEEVDRIRAAEDAADTAYLQENLPAALAAAQEGITRMSAIVRAMKEFAHPDRKEADYADINRAIEATLTIAHNEYKYVADAVTDLKPLPPVRCHLGDLNQVFLNLIVNAAHSIEERVATDGGRGRICVRTRQMDNATVKIEIEDSGSGIPPEIRSRIFDPFFTTKPVGKGSGQGLAIARSIVVGKHAGSLSFQTEVGHGTTFTIKLPVHGIEPIGSTSE